MKNDRDDEPLTRSAYRESERRANQRNDRERVKKFADDLIHRTHHDQRSTSDSVVSDDSATPSAGDQPFSRERSASEMKAELNEAKTARLKHKLNIAIIVLIALIILVYLILFFVG